MDGEQITQNPDISFNDLHPTVTAGGKYPGEEDGWIKCRQCGFMIKEDRHSPGSGWGNTEYEYTTSHATYCAAITYSSVDVQYDGEYYIDSEMAGCPFCNASEYE